MDDPSSAPGAPPRTDDDHDHHRLEELRQAAIRAEQETGRREATVEEARRHIVVRLVIAVVGAVIALAGLAMLVLPGPGIAVVLIGLGIMATEVPWAARVLDEVKRRAKVDKIKQQPAWVKAVAIVGGIGAGVASAVLTLT